MKTKPIPSSITEAAAAMLGPYVPNLTPAKLRDIFAAYQEDAPPAGPVIETPVTRKEAARLLGLSLPTISRFLNAGKLRRVKYTSRAVKVDPASIRELMQQSIVKG